MELSNAVLTIANELLQHACNERCCFDEIELEAAGKSLLSECAGAVEQQAEFLTGEEVHEWMLCLSLVESARSESRKAAVRDLSRW